jgi:hypothetical protein
MNNRENKIDNLPLDSDEDRIIGEAYNDGFIDYYEAKHLINHPAKAREYISRGDDYDND